MGAALELLGGSRIHGVLSTHLHRELVSMPLQLPPTIRFKRMGVQRTTRFPCNANALRNSTCYAFLRSSILPGCDPSTRVETAESAQCPNHNGDVAAGPDESDNLGLEEHIHTFELLDGVCTDSNAAQTARRVGMPQSVIARALQLQKHFDAARPLGSVFAGATTATALHQAESVSAAATEEHSAQLTATLELGSADRLAGQSARQQENGEKNSDKKMAASDLLAPVVPDENGWPGTGNVDVRHPREATQHSRQLSAYRVPQYAYSNAESADFMMRLKTALVEAVQRVTCHTATPEPLWRREMVPREEKAQREEEDVLTDHADRPLCSLPQVVQLPSLSSQLMPPPTWQDGAACVYVLVAPGKVPADACRECYTAADGVRSPFFGLDRNLVQLPGFHARVYVGETERLLSRLRGHGRSPLWAHAQVIAVRVADKGVALRTETALINKLKEEAGVILFSLKDGNRRISAGLSGEGLAEHLRHVWRQQAGEGESSPRS